MIFMAARLGRNLRQVRNWLHPMHYAGRDLTSLTLFLIACQDNVAMLVYLLKNTNFVTVATLCENGLYGFSAHSSYCLFNVYFANAGHANTVFCIFVNIIPLPSVSQRLASYSKLWSTLAAIYRLYRGNHLRLFCFCVLFVVVAV